MAWYKYVFGVPTVIGCMIGSGFVVPAFWFVSLAGVAWCIWYCQQSTSLTLGLAAAWWTWTIKSLFPVSYFLSAYPIDWLGFSLGPLEPVVIAFYWITVAVWLGVGGLVLYGGVYVVRAAPNWIAYAAIPVIWLLAELFGALSFSVFTFGPGGAINTQFSFGFVGYLLAQHAWLAQLASVGGVFGLSIVATGLALFGQQLWLRRYRVIGVLSVVGFLLTSVITFPTQPIPDQSFYTVATINTSFPTTSRFTEQGVVMVQTQLQTALDAAIAMNADYVLLPEDARLFDQSDTATLRAYLGFKYGQTDTIIVDSGRVAQGEQAVLQATIYDSNETAMYQSQKRYLVPQGEFLPYLYQGVLQAAGYGQAVDFLSSELSYRVGDDTSQADFAAHIPGVLFCFESNDPLGVRTIIRERNDSVPFIAHVISHAWFHTPRVLWQQTEAMLRVQSIWNDTYIVSASNHAPSYTVDPYGELMLPEVVAAGEYWELGVTQIPVR